ncbi:MAG: GNAT family N-acetyltransferase [Saprospiraceae bacterium]|nr:GNAT family N-acetyltransferase [Saprospiraceae bacterium]MDW8228401.1 GNAT family N-acetyltransferase [Saprospiraceae bacterium]
MVIHYKRVQHEEEIAQILALQAYNLPSAISPEQASSQGFVTVKHDPEVLRRMNAAFPSVIAKEGDRLAGYCLVMLREFAPEVPVLAPLFERLEQLEWRGRPLSAGRWFVMGQICVAEPYRGKGVFDGMYRHLADVCRLHFDFVVTEVAERNTRSLRAHERVGFETFHIYDDPTTGERWHIIAWNWE